jgi:enterochelin esterase-like enzyme
LRFLSGAVLAGLVSLWLAGGAPARAQSAGAQSPGAQSAPAELPRTGEKLKDAKGAVLGHIERVVSDAGGRPRQVLVRVARVLHVLPIDALTRSGDAYVTVLSRAELEALPATQ